MRIINLISLVLSIIALCCGLYVLSAMQWRSEWDREFGGLSGRMEVLEDVMNAAQVIERSPSGYAKFIDE